MTRTVQVEVMLFTIIKETEQNFDNQSTIHLRCCDNAPVKSFSVPVFKKMFVPLMWQGLVYVWELLNFRSDSTKKLFKK
jgi:hypothetical protein